jgi:hypothetical protein
MATVGWIKVGVAADTTEFARGMTAAAKQTESLGSQLKTMAGAYVGFEALKAGASSLKSYVTGAVEGISQSTTLAERVGMSSTAFQKLSYSARLAHIDQDGLAISLEQMNKRLGEVAVEGSGPAADALRRFGVNAYQVTQMGTEQAFEKLLGVLGEIKNPMERAAVATDLFGKSGQAVINMAAQGLGALKAQGEQATEWGTALNKIDNAKVEEAWVSMAKLSEAAAGFANQVATQLAPFITELTDRYVEWGYQGSKSASFISQGMDWVVTGIGLSTDAVNGFLAAWYALSAGSTKVVAGMLDQISHLGSAWDWFVGKGNGQQHQLMGADSLKAFADSMKATGAEQAEAASKHFAEIGAGVGNTRKLVDDIVRGANARAEMKVNESTLFNAPGALSRKPEEKTTFSGALDLGSKDAYSSVVRNMVGRTEQTEQRKIAAATVRSAGANERTVALLQQIAQGGKSEKPLTPHLAAAF